MKLFAIHEGRRTSLRFLLLLLLGNVVVWTVFLSAREVQGHVRLPVIFSHRMVLQRGQPVPVWGWASPGEKITVEFAGQHHTTITNPSGRWQVTLRPLQTGSSQSMKIRGHNEIVLQDVVVGEVWLCSGQSNMSWPVHRTIHGSRVLRTINSPMIRMFAVPFTVARTPRTDCAGRWQHATPQTVRGFSAVCFYFGQLLQRKLGIPVGLIQSSVGGTRAEAWTPRSTLAASPTLRWVFPAQKRWEQRRSMLYSLYQRRYRQWRQAVLSRQTGQQASPRPEPPLPAWHYNSPSGLYNGMIAPIERYGIKGTLWYQGESNLGRHRQYTHLMSVMIGAWRKRWKQGDFPFLFVQIAPFRYRGNPPDLYNKLCEAQVGAWRSIPHTAMVSTHDISDIHDIHPRQKREVGRRLFLAALSTAYGHRRVRYSGPIYRSMQRKGERLVLSFDHVGKGLVARGGTLRHFVIAGPDRRFYPATAKIVGRTVEVWSPKVKHPVAARLAWRDDMIHNLFNLAGFPASTFRTDQWNSR